MKTSKSDIGYWYNLTAIGIVSLAVLIFLYEMTQAPWSAKVDSLDRLDLTYVKCKYGSDIYVTYNAQNAIRDGRFIYMTSPTSVVILQDPSRKCSIVK